MTKEEFKNVVNKLLSPDVKDKLKSAFVKFSEQPVAVTEAEPVAEVKLANEVKLADGSALSVDGDLAVGASVKLVTPDGLNEVADGEYITTDNKVVTVMSGAIAEIATKEEEAPEDENEAPVMPAMMQEMKAEMSALKKELSELKAELSEAKETVKLSLSALNTIVEAPVAEPEEQQLNFEALTPFQKYKLAKYGKI